MEGTVIPDWEDIQNSGEGVKGDWKEERSHRKQHRGREKFKGIKDRGTLQTGFSVI